jgi:GDSL-like Lipase/Acylhydrolase family
MAFFRRLVSLTALLALLVSVTPQTASALPFQCTGQGTQGMIHVDGAFARALNTWSAAPVGRLLKFQCYPAVGRDTAGEWIYVQYGNAHVWVHRNDVRFKDGFDVYTLKALDIPDLIPPAPLTQRAAGVPTVSKAMRDLYARGVKAGRAPDVVTVIGDCNSEAPVYFGRVNAGVLNLSALPDLQRTAVYFGKSFGRSSVATNGSFSSGMAFDSAWSDPAKCGADGPFGCELKLSNASVVIIALGTGDTFTWQDFEGNLRKIVDYAIAQNVVPVLMTKADSLESQQAGAPADAINAAVRRVGAAYGVPVIDFAQAVRALPNNGLVDERNTDGKVIDAFHINELGMDTRMVMTLQTLSQLGRIPPAKATPRPRVRATPKP